MDLNKLFSGEGVQVINPNYTGKRDKKNPKYINLPATEENQSNIYSDALSSVPDYGNTFKDVDADKYEKYGITISRPTLANIEDELAEAQSMWDKAFNSLAQTAGEIVLGGLSAMGTLAEAAWKAPIALLDIGTSEAIKLFTDEINTDPNRLRRSLGIDDNDYSNWWSEAFDNFKEKWNNEVVPIYAERDAGINNPSWSWFFKGLPTVASTLTLLLPTQAAMTGVKYAAKGAKYLGKAAKIAKNIEKAESVGKIAAAEKAAGITEDALNLSPIKRYLSNPIRQASFKHGMEIGAEGLLMRTLENYQEAHQTHELVYDEALNMSDDKFKTFVNDNKDILIKNGVDINSKHEVAKYIAGQAADRTFVYDYANTVFDIWQLMTLPKLGKITKKATGRGVEKAEREGAAYMENIAKAESKAAAKEALNTTGEKLITKSGKYKNAVKDFIKGSGMTILGQSSEGVEEIINYISQQEGATYGRTLYDKESVLTGNERLKQYIADPQMWESGFWGVFGGVAFGGVHGAINKYNINRNTKKLFNAITKDMSEEQRKEFKESDAWLSMREQAASSAAVNAIKNRQNHFITLQSRLEKLENENINPLDKNKPIEGDVDVQKAIIRAQLIQDYRRELAVDAINSGTYDSLITHLTSNEVKQAFINLGIVSQDNADGFIQDTIKDLEEAKNTYYNELSRVNAAVTRINSTRSMREQIPIEYVKLIAEHNTSLALKNIGLNRQIEGLESVIATLSTGDEVEASHDIAISLIADQYGMLDAQRRILESDAEVKDREGNPVTEWRRQRAIEDIKFQQKALLDSIGSFYVDSKGNPINNGEPARLGAMLNVIRSGKAYRFTGDLNLDTNLLNRDNYVEDFTDEDYKATDEQLIEKYELGNKSIEVSTISQMAKLQRDTLHALSGENGLYNTNTRLFNAYLDRSSLEIARAINSAQMVTSVKRVAERVDELFNEHSKVRSEQIQRASDIIVDIYNKCQAKGQESIHQAILKAYFNNREEAYNLARTYLTDRDNNGVLDADNFITALKTINFSAGANKLALLFINKRIEQAKQKISPNSKKTQPNTQGPAVNPAPNTNGLTKVNAKVVNGINGTFIQITHSGKTYNLGLQNTRTQNTYSVIFPQNADEGDKYNIVTHSGLFNNLVGTPTIGDTLNMTEQPLVKIEDESGIKTVYLVTKGSAEIVKGQPAVNPPGGQAGPGPSSGPVIEDEELDEGYTIDDGKDDELNLVLSSIQSDVSSILSNILTDTEKEINKINADSNYWVNYENNIFNKYKDDSKLKETYTDDQLKEKIHEYVEGLKSTIEAIKVSNSKLTNAANSITLASMNLDTTSPVYGSIFTHSCGQLLDEYVAREPLRTFTETVGNTTKTVKLISLRDIIRLCMNTQGLNNKAIATHLQFSFIEYIENYNKEHYSLEGGNTIEYRIVDLEDAYNGDIVRYIDKSVEEIIEIEGKNTNGIANEQRIQIVRGKTKEENDRINKWFANAKPDDEVIAMDDSNYTSDKDGNIVEKTEEQKRNTKETVGDIWLYANDDKGMFVVGRLARANSRNNGLDYFKNMGLCYDLYWKEDHVESPLLDALVAIFTFYDDTTNIEASDQAKAIIELRKLLAQNCTNNFDGAQGKAKLIELGKQIVNNAFFDGTTLYNIYTGELYETPTDTTLRDVLIYRPKKKNKVKKTIFNPNTNKYEDTYIENDATPEPDYENVARKLLNLWGYTFYRRDNLNPDDAKDVIKASLINWFEKLYDSYDSLNVVVENGTRLRITEVKPGAPEFATKAIDYNQYLPFSEAVAEPSKTRLSYTERGKTITSQARKAKEGEASSKDAGRGQQNGSSIAVFTTNKYPTYFRAAGLRFYDNSREETNPAFNQILGEIAAEFNKKITILEGNLASSRASGKPDLSLIADFEDFISSVINVDGSDGKIPLFTPKNGSRFMVNRLKSSNNQDDIGVSYSYLYNNKIYSFNVFYKVVTKKGQSKYNLGFGYSILDDLNKDDDGNPIVIKSVKAIHKDKSGTTLYKDFYDMLLGKDGFLHELGQINIGRDAINTDNRPGADLSGLFTRTDDGKLRFKVGNIDKTYDDYNDFIFSNSLIRVNTRINKDTGTNFSPKSQSASDETKNRVMKIDFGIRRTKKSSNFSTLYQNSETNEQAWKSIHNAIDNSETDTTDNSRKVVNVDELFDAAGTELGDSLKRVRQLESEEGISDEESLIPTNVVYDERLNVLTNNSEELGPVAVTAVSDTQNEYTIYRQQDNTVSQETKTVSIGSIVIGNKFVNNLSHKVLGTAALSVRTLIHERLHTKFNSSIINREEFLKQLKPIYEEFIRDVENNLDTKGIDGVISSDIANYITRWIDYYKDNPDTDRVLEEFAVECLTSNAFFTYMNSIETTDELKNKQSLFDKFINFITKLFGWEVKDKTLNARYFNLLRDMTPPVGSIDNSNPSPGTPNTDNTNEDEDEDEDEDDTFSRGHASTSKQKKRNRASFSLDTSDTRNQDLYTLANATSLNNKSKFRSYVRNGFINIKCK